MSSVFVRESDDVDNDEMPTPARGRTETEVLREKIEKRKGCTFVRVFPRVSWVSW